MRCYKKVDDKIEVLGDSACTKEKPESEKACMQRPCDGVDWITTEWSGVSILQPLLGPQPSIKKID